MLRKICRIGNSQGILIPKEILKKLHLAPGAKAEVTLDEKAGKIIIEPVASKLKYGSIDIEFASQVKEFIEHYKPALKALSKK